MAQKKKKPKIKNTKIKCVGGRGKSLLCLISNTLPQFEQSSLHPSTVLHHCHLLQTTCYNHLLLLLHLLISREENPSSNRLGTPLSQGVGAWGWDVRKAFGLPTHYRMRLSDNFRPKYTPYDNNFLIDIFLKTRWNLYCFHSCSEVLSKTGVFKSENVDL